MHCLDKDIANGLNNTFSQAGTYADVFGEHSRVPNCDDVSAVFDNNNLEIKLDGLPEKGSLK